MIGKTFNHYTIVRKLGEGGMGLVYLAKDTSLDRNVALKFLPESLQQDPTARKLFLREAKSAAALDHPYICNIFQVGEEEGTAFIAMEYVPGETLKEMMIDGPLPLNEAIRIAVEIAEAIEKAHQEGIVHRDLKPSNIMLTPEGHVKVMDFGLAKQVVTIGQDEGADLTASLTMEGATVGTPGYMSPEQLRGERLDTRSDLFSFGIILFEMLTGTHPFKREQPYGTALAILSDPPPQLEEYLPDPPKPLKAILEKTLMKGPDQRYFPTSELRQEISSLLEPGIQRSRLLERPALLAMGIVLAVLIAGVFSLVSRRGSPIAVDFTNYEFITLAGEADDEIRGAWSSDGAEVVYQQRFADLDWRIMRRPLDAIAPQTLLSLPVHWSPYYLFWSHGDTTIYYDDYGRYLAKYPPDGIVDDEEMVLSRLVYAADIHPTENLIACWGPDGLTIERTDSLAVDSFDSFLPLTGDPRSTRAYIRFSPDGRSLGLITSRLSNDPSVESGSGESGSGNRADSGTGDSGRFGFWVIPWPCSEGMKIKEAFEEELMPLEEIPSFDWLSDSEHVVISLDGSLWIGNTRKSDLYQILKLPTSRAINPAVSPDGNRILYDQEVTNFDLIEIPFDGSEPHVIMNTSELESSPSYSRDTGVLAYRFGHSRIRLDDPDSTSDTIIDLLDSLPAEIKPAEILDPVVISPDGEWLAFRVSGQHSGMGVWMLSTQGWGEARRVFPNNGTEIENLGFSWSPDSQSLAACNRNMSGDTRTRLEIVQRSNIEVSRTVHTSHVADLFFWMPTWSPDSQWIACLTNDQAGREVLLISPDNENTTRRISNPSFGWDRQNIVLFWSRDERTLYLASTYLQQEHQRGLWAIDIENDTSNKIRGFSQELELLSPVDYGLLGSLTPSGNSFITTRGTHQSDLIILKGFPLPKMRSRR
ncbi:protein kinase [Gemmatimonadota bacterium]